MNARTRLAALLLLALPFACAPAEPAAAPAPPAPPPPVASTAASPPAAEAPPKVRLPGDTRPTAETLEIHIDPTQDRFSGTVDISVTLDHPRAVVWLHGKDMRVTRATATPDGGAEIPATWTQQDSGGLASLQLAQPLPAGKARLHVEYDAPFGPKLEGLYKATQGGVSYAFTQFESIAARDAFPCFDEPSFKIPFTTTLVVPSGDQAISNTHETGRETDASGVHVHFAPTLPLPSYLIAFAVGPLDVVAGPDVPPNAVRSRPLPLRAVTMKGHGKDIAYALAHAGDFITLLEQFFGIEYPFDKLDILAVGDKGGAMENAGAVTFADDLLLFDEKTAPIWQKHDYAEVMAHELAHQWTGDLVTAAWWDDIWLNEAFATWIASKIADQWDPTVESSMALLQGVQRAIGSDALVSARAVRQPIASNDDIENAFDSITYEKGGGVLSMFERWVGSDAFRRGLHDYLQAHRFGNATADDFLAAESNAAGKDLKTPFATFLDQPGVPFVEAQVVCDGSPHVHLKQSRYFPMGSSGDPNATWQIPVCARYGLGRETQESCALLTTREGDLPVGPKCPDWVLPNADAAGYFRFSLSPADLKKLQTRGFASLSARERVAYANSLRAAYNRGSLPMKDVIEAAAVLATDPHPEIAREPMGFIDDAYDWLYADKLRAAVRRYAQRVYGPTFARLGWKVAKGEDEHKTQLRREVVNDLAFTVRDPAVRAQAKKLGLAYLGVGKDNSIHEDAVDANLVGATLAVVGEEADRPLWDGIKARLATAEDPVLRGRLLAVLTSPRSADLVPAVRDLAFDPSLRATETMSGVWSKLDDPETREATWTWVKANFDKLLAAAPKHHGQTQLIRMGADFCDEAHAEDVEAFFTPARIAGIDGAPRVLQNTLENIRLCAAKRKLQEPSARAFFAAQ